MAVPSLTTAWCADFVSPSVPWLSEPGMFEQMGPPYDCQRGYVLLGTHEWVAVLDAAGGSAPDPGGAFTTQEVAMLKHLAANPSPFNLSVEDGAYISGLIVTVWAITWGIRALARALRVGEPESD